MGTNPLPPSFKSFLSYENPIDWNRKVLKREIAVLVVPEGEGDEGKGEVVVGGAQGLPGGGAGLPPGRHGVPG